MKYTLYAKMKNGSRLNLKIDDDYLKVLTGFIRGDINRDVIRITDSLIMFELDFLYKLTNGECEYLLIKSKGSKVIHRLDLKPISMV